MISLVQCTTECDVNAEGGGEACIADGHGQATHEETGRIVRCAPAVRKVGYFGPVFPGGQGGTVTIVFPTTQILTHSKNSDSELKHTVFPTKNARWQSKGMPCTQCARSAKFWMSANTRTLVSAPFHKFLVPYQGFF